jgi:hypothetical protein
MEKKYFLMLKTHTQTKLKYLCFHHGTASSCYTYKGSGSYWTAHLSKHGKDITTEILLESFNKDDISIRGIQLSREWDIVNSKEFANLTIEDAQTTAEPLQRPEVRRKRLESFKSRIKRDGLTDREKNAKQTNSKVLQTPEVREKAANTFRIRIKSGNLTDKERKRGVNQSKRIKEKGFTEAELKSHKEISVRQKGKTMIERLNNPNYVDPRTGKSATEIFGESYTGPWNKGKAVKDLKGDDYTDPRCQPFTITSHLGVHKYNNEREFLVDTKLPQPTLAKLKREGVYVVKRQSNTKHSFIHGETIYYKII